MKVDIEFKELNTNGDYSYCIVGYPFRIFYNMNGDKYSPKELVFSKSNTVPDYIIRIYKAFFQAFIIYTQKCHFKDPLKEGIYFEKGARFIDIHIADIPTQKGLVAGELIDNSKYFKEDNLKGESVRITLHRALIEKSATPIHELFHVFQYSYCSFNNMWFMEGLARWSQNLIQKRPNKFESLPQNQEELIGLMNRAHDAEYFFRQFLSFVRYPKEFVKVILEECAKQANILQERFKSSNRYVQNAWSREDKKSPLNNRYIFQAFINALNTHELKKNNNELACFIWAMKQYIESGNDSLNKESPLLQDFFATLKKCDENLVYELDGFLHCDTYDIFTKTLKVPDLSLNLSKIQLESFSFLEIIEGNLVLEGCKDVEYLNGFNHLKKVNSLTIKKMDSLEVISGFNKLKSMNSLVIDDNKKLKEISGFNDFFLENSEVSGAIKIINNSFLENISFLNGLCKVKSSFYLHNNNLKNLKGLESLEEVGASFSLSSNSLISLKELKSLKKVFGMLGVAYNNLKSLSGLENLEYVKNTTWNGQNRTIVIHGNQNLDDISALKNVLTKERYLILYIDDYKQYKKKPKSNSNFHKNILELYDIKEKFFVPTFKFVEKRSHDYSDFGLATHNEKIKYLLDFEMKSDILVISFSGYNGHLGGIFNSRYPFLTNELKTNKLFILDEFNSWYHDGIKNFTSNIDETIEFIKKVVAFGNYQKVVCFGASMGGYFSLLIARLIGVTNVIAFSPQTFLDDENREKYGDTRWKKPLQRLNRKKEKYLDLKPLYEGFDGKGLDIEIHYSKNEKLDELHVKHLANKNIKVIGYEKSDHYLAVYLHKKGLLEDLVLNHLGILKPQKTDDISKKQDNKRTILKKSPSVEVYQKVSDIDTVSGDLIINNTNEQIVNGSHKLKKIEGTLCISNNDHLVEIKGFDALEYVKNIEISYNKNLHNIQAFSKLFNKLKKIEGYIKVINNKKLTTISFFTGLEKVRSSFYLHHNALKSLKGLESLKYIGASFSLSSNKIDSLIPLSNLEEVNGALSLVNNNLISLNGLERLSKLKTIKWNGKDRTIAIFGNKNLYDIQALHNIQSNDKRLIIEIDAFSQYIKKPEKNSSFYTHKLELFDKSINEVIDDSLFKDDAVTFKKSNNIIHLKAFENIALCASGNNCGICRNHKYGRAWREQLFGLIPLPQNSIDFECPYGRNWSRYGYVSKKEQLSKKRFLTIDEQLQLSEEFMDDVSFPKKNWGKSIDIVYPYLASEEDTSDELKYSLRSLENIYEDVNVWIVGDKPEWLDESTVRYIPHVKDENSNFGYEYSYIDSRAKIKLAAQNENMGEHFILMNDDLYLIKPVSASFIGIPRFFADYTDKLDSFKIKADYHKTQYRGFKFLEQRGCSLKDFSLHWPYLHSTEKYLELYEEAKLDKVPHNHETLYYNMYGEKQMIYAGELLRANKVVTEDFKLEDIPSGVYILNNKMNGFKWMEHTLKKLFPKPSKYEKIWDGNFNFKYKDKKIIYIFAPHPDDEVIACGGTIAKKIQEGYKVKIVLLTSGEKSHRKYSSQKLKNLNMIREEEFKKAVATLGVQMDNLLFLRYPDMKLNENIQNAMNQLRKVISSDAEYIEEVYFPHKEDSNKDHQATFTIVQNVLNQMGYINLRYMYLVWGKLKKVEDYTTSKSSIVKTLELKKEALFNYKSQFTYFIQEQVKPILSQSFFERNTQKNEIFFQTKDTISDKIIYKHAQKLFHNNIKNFKQLTNRSSKVYKVDTYIDKSFIIKYKKKNQDIIYREIVASSYFKELPYLPKLYCHDNQYVVQNFIEGKPLSEVKTQEKGIIYKKLGEYIKDMHTIVLKGCGRIKEDKSEQKYSFKEWFEKKIKKDLSLINDNSLINRQNYNKIVHYFEENESILDTQECYLIHNDLEEHNIIVDSVENIYIIDFGDLALFPKEMDLVKIYMDTYDTDLFSYFLKGYGEFNIDLLKFCAISSVVQLIAANPKSNRIQSILQKRTEVLFKLISEER